jgi:hypothetical protein
VRVPEESPSVEVFAKKRLVETLIDWGHKPVCVIDL